MTLIPSRAYTRSIINNFHKAMSKNSNAKTFPLGRDSRTGEFIPVREARNHPNTSTVERVPKAGNGDTGRGRKK